MFCLRRKKLYQNVQLPTNTCAKLDSRNNKNKVYKETECGIKARIERLCKETETDYPSHSILQMCDIFLLCLIFHTNKMQFLFLKAFNLIIY
jgi:hypothetical protein